MKLAAVAAVALALAANPKDPTKRFTAADTRLATAIALRQSDLPAGWKRIKSDTSTGTCRAQPDESKLIETADVDPTFESPNQAIDIDSEVQIFATTAMARTDWSYATLKMIHSCSREELAKALGPAAKMTVTEVAPPNLGAERAKAFHMAVSATVKGRHVEFESGLVAIGKGRVDVILTWFAPKGLLEPTAATPLLRVLSSRLAKT